MWREKKQRWKIFPLPVTVIVLQILRPIRPLRTWERFVASNSWYICILIQFFSLTCSLQFIHPFILHNINWFYRLIECLLLIEGNIVHLGLFLFGDLTCILTSVGQVELVSFFFSFCFCVWFTTHLWFHNLCDSSLMFSYVANNLLFD